MADPSSRKVRVWPIRRQPSSGLKRSSAPPTYAPSIGMSAALLRGEPALAEQLPTTLLSDCVRRCEPSLPPCRPIALTPPRSSLRRPRAVRGGRSPVHRLLRGAGCGVSTIPLLRTSANKALLLNANLVVLAYGR